MKKLIPIIIACILIAMGLSSCRNPDVVSAGIYFYQQNNADKAEELLVNSLKTNPNDFEAHYMLGQVYAHKKKYPEMISEFDASLAIKSKYQAKIDSTKEKHFFNLYNGAVENFNKGVLDKTIDQLNTALLIEPGDQQGWALLGKSYIRNQNHDEALLALEKAVELDPELEAINDHVLLMQIHYENEDYDKALDISANVLERDPKNIDAVKIAAFCYNAIGETDKALEYYQNLLIEEPDDPDLVFNMGILYEQMEKYDEAIELFIRAFELNPQDFEAILHCAQVFLDIKGDNLKAVECYEKALEIEPDNAGVLNNYGIALIRAGEQNEDQSLITRGTEAIKRATELRETGQ